MRFSALAQPPVLPELLRSLLAREEVPLDDIGELRELPGLPGAMELWRLAALASAEMTSEGDRE